MCLTRSVHEPEHQLPVLCSACDIRMIHVFPILHAGLGVYINVFINVWIHKVIIARKS